MPCLGMLAQWTLCFLDHWRTKPTERKLLFPLQFDSSAGQPSEPVLTILYGFTGVAVWLGLSGVYGSSDV